MTKKSTDPQKKYIRSILGMGSGEWKPWMTGTKRPADSVTTKVIMDTYQIKIEKRGHTSKLRIDNLKTRQHIGSATFNDPVEAEAKAKQAIPLLRQIVNYQLGIQSDLPDQYVTKRGHWKLQG